MSRISRSPRQGCDGAQTPEGPYESGTSRSSEIPPANTNFGDFLELFEELQHEAAHLLGLAEFSGKCG